MVNGKLLCCFATYLNKYLGRVGRSLKSEA